VVRAGLLGHAGEHPAGSGHRVLHLAPAADDLQHGRAHLSGTAAGGLAQLPERRGVQVEPLQADPGFVRPQGRAGIEFPGGLREHARRLDHPVQPER
jgi:hypothetical protein